jgi:hypothetical protein
MAGFLEEAGRRVRRKGGLTEVRKGRRDFLYVVTERPLQCPIPKPALTSCLLVGIFYNLNLRFSARCGGPHL